MGVLSEVQGGGRMKIRQARKIFRRAISGRKANEYFSRIKLQTYDKAIDSRYAEAKRVFRKRRKDAGE
jgi:intergrase/recombinase